MSVRPVTIFLVALAGLQVAAGQSSVPQSKERSHVERFSTPEVRAEKAEADANARLIANPNDDTALDARAVARIRLGRNKEAYEDLRRAVALKPDYSDYQANLGYVLWKLGRPEEAVGAERAALNLDARNASAHYQLGRFLLRIGNRKNLN